MFLLDTSIVSVVAPSRRQPHAVVAGWLDRHNDHLFLSTTTLAELWSGIAKSRREGASDKAGRLASWLDSIIHLYGSRILPLDVAIARTLGDMMDEARRIGRTPGLADLTIAATARHWGLTVLTRNLRHFQMVDVAALDPFDTLPADAPGARRQAPR